MERIKIITDSCSDLPKKVVDKYNITMLPTPVHFGENIYQDRTGLTPQEFYKKLDETDQLPKTSRISPDIFCGEFEKALQGDYDRVLAILFSSELSGIFESAVLAKKQLGSEKIRVIDSKSASVGLGVSVVKAARAIEEGKSFTEVIEITKNSCAHMEHIFAVGSLEMLKRGGRISRGEAFVGNILNIKPILHFQDGKILPYTKVRGKKKMLNFLFETMVDRGYNLEDQLIGLNYSYNSKLAEELKEKISNRYKIDDFLISEIGAAIGAHAGKNTVSVFFHNEEEIADIKVV